MDTAELERRQHDLERIVQVVITHIEEEDPDITADVKNVIGKRGKSGALNHHKYDDDWPLQFGDYFL